MPWYIFIPPNFWIIVGSLPPSCPFPKNYLCALQANDNSGQPIITLALQIEIANAVNNRTESTNVKLKPTP
jgi:hypothetical protein